MNLAVLLQGFVLGGSLIVAIGAQNAFILRQGLLQRHVFVLCLICAMSDALLIAAGVAGLGTMIARSPSLIWGVTIAGAMFLFVYGARAVQRSLHPSAMTAATSGPKDLRSAIAACLAFTFLNPHVYLDTVLLIGGLSAQYNDPERFMFGLGAASASFVWFFLLGYGARLLTPLFERAVSWRILDALIALVMFAIALSLLRSLL